MAKRIKNYDGYISFQFNMENELEKKIYLDIIEKRKPVRGYIISEILKNHYFNTIENNKNEDKLFRIVENLSEAMIGRQIVANSINNEDKQINKRGGIKQKENKMEVNKSIDQINKNTNGNDVGEILEKIYENSIF